MSNSIKTFFVGRENEKDHLLFFAKDALAGKVSTAFVTGEAGIGKTALVEEVIRQLQEQDQNIVVACGRCNVREASFLPFRTMLEKLLENDRSIQGSGEKSRKVMEIVVETIWTVGPDLIGVFGLPIKALQVVVDKLGFRKRKELNDIQIPKDLEPNQIYGWYTKITQEISSRFPLILFIDDLHWADESSLNLLFHLGRELEKYPILLIATYRPHNIRRNSRLSDVKIRLEEYGAREFSLDVSEDDTADLNKTKDFVHTYLLEKYGTNFSDRSEKFLADRTRGNALFLTELLKNMEEKGQIIPFHSEANTNGQGKGVQWQIKQELERIEDLPDKVESVIKERIDRLEKGLREILTYASIEGDDFLAQVIAQAKQVDEWMLIDELTEKLMIQHQLIWERGGKFLPNGSRVHEFSFRHNLIREYMYSQLSKSIKEHLHAQIGTSLEHLYEPNAHEIAGVLATHFRLGYILPKALSYALKAAQDANTRYGAAEAVRYVKLGMDALEELSKKMPQTEYAEHKLQLTIELAQAEEYGGEPQDKKDHIQAGIGLLETSLMLLQQVSEELQAEYYAQLGKLYKRKGGKKLQEAKSYFENALYLYEKNGENKKAAEICYLLGDVYGYFPSCAGELSPSEHSIEVLERCLTIGKHLQDIDLQSRALSSLAWKYISKDFNDAREFATQALALSNNSGKVGKYAEIRSHVAMAAIYRRYAKHKTGNNHLLEALELAKRTGDIFAQSEILNDFGYDCDFYMSLKDIAKHTLEESIAIKERLGSQKAASLNNLAWIFAEQGEWKEAESYWRKAMTEMSERSQSLYQYHVGILYTFQDRFAEAKANLLQRIPMLEKYSSPSYSVYMRIAKNYAKSGSKSECKRAMELAELLFSKATIPRAKSVYLCERAETYRVLQEYISAKESCDQALTWFLNNVEDPEDYQYVAEARLVMGKILVDMGEYQDAIGYLDKAKTAFTIGKHYTLGETILYLGKAYLGIGNQPQAKKLITDAHAEFQRLDLSKKEQEAEEMLNKLL